MRRARRDSSTGCSTRWRSGCARLRETELIARLLRPLATHPAARGLLDDAAVLTPPLGRDLVFTHDMLAEGVHFLADDPPGDVAWKLVAVNLSDLAAMGAKPIGVLLGLGLAGRPDAWIEGFAEGLAEALARWAVALLGGDTIGGIDRPVLGLTAIGQVAPGMALSRGGANPGDALWVTGNIGDAALGLAVARGERAPDAALLARYRRPEPRLAFGAALAGLASAAIDVSDGLLLDAARLAEASGLAATVELARLPRSRAAEAAGVDALALATGGDDYELLFAVAQARAVEVEALARRLKTRVTRVGGLAAGAGLTTLGERGEAIAPGRLGWEHGAHDGE